MTNVFSRFVGKIRRFMCETEPDAENNVSKLFIGGRARLEQKKRLESEQVSQTITTRLTDSLLRILKNSPFGLDFESIIRSMEFAGHSTKQRQQLEDILENQLCIGGLAYYSPINSVYRAMDTDKFDSEVLEMISLEGAINSSDLADKFRSHENIVTATCERLEKAGKVKNYEGNRYRLTTLRGDDTRVLEFLKNQNKAGKNMGLGSLGVIYNSKPNSLDFLGSISRLEKLGEIIQFSGQGDIYCLPKGVATSFGLLESRKNNGTPDEALIKTLSTTDVVEKTQINTLDEATIERMRSDIKFSIDLTPGQALDEILSGFADQVGAWTALKDLENHHEVYQDEKGLYFISEDTKNRFYAGKIAHDPFLLQAFF